MTRVEEAPSAATQLLQGMRVLSFCHYLQGPAATQYLADMGADVITVEPIQGAFERRWAGASTFVEDVSAFFLAANRNKRSLAVDLKHPNARELLQRLIATADALVENYRPGVMARLGLGYDDVRRIKPDIIYASATGFGADGPLRDKPGQDLLIQARSGLVASTGVTPTAIGCAAVDQHGAALLAMGVAAAYVKKLTTKKGTRIEGSLFSAGVDLQTEALTLYFTGQRNRERFGRDPHLASWFHEAPYGIYEIADGFVAISLNPVQKIADGLDSARLKALAESDPYQARDAIAAALADELLKWRFDELAERFDPAGIWYERVQDYDDLRNDPQAVHNEMFTTIPVRNREAILVKHPLRYDGSAAPLRRMPPEIGEHSAEILQSLGFSESEIGRLLDTGVVAQSGPNGGGQ